MPRNKNLACDVSFFRGRARIRRSVCGCVASSGGQSAGWKKVHRLFYRKQALGLKSHTFSQPIATSAGNQSGRPIAGDF